MGNLGFQELLVIAAVALIVIGPDRLPEMARQAARALARFRQETRTSLDELKRAADLEDLDREFRGFRRELRDARSSVTGALTGAAESAAGTARPRPEDRPPPTDPDAT